MRFNVIVKLFPVLFAVRIYTQLVNHLGLIDRCVGYQCQNINPLICAIIGLYRMDPPVQRRLCREHSAVPDHSSGCHVLSRRIAENERSHVAAA